MPYRTRGVFAGEESVASETARTEVLAKAFNDAAGEYFEREHEYEQGIEANRERMQSLRLVAGAAVVVGAALALVGRSLPSVALGAVVALGGLIYSYIMSVRLKDQIKQYQEQIALNSPDGSVSAVRQVGVPFYLVPYDGSHLIFDGLGETPANEIPLAHVDTEQLTGQQRELAELVETYDEHLGNTNVATPEYVEEMMPAAGTHRELERPLSDKIDEMRATMKHPQTEQRTVTAHGTNQVAQSIAALSAADELHDGTELPELSQEPSRADWDQTVAEARALRHDALDEETLAPIRESTERVEELTEPAVTRLDDNRETVTDHYEDYAALIDRATHKQTCQNCLLERVDRLASELSLLSDVLGDQTGEFGATLDDPDLEAVATDGGVSAKETLHQEIDSSLPAASEQLQRAYNSLPNLSEKEFCPEHGDVERVSVSDDGVLFGTVWRCLYDEFRDGVLDAATELEATAEHRRAQKEQNMVNLAKYEGISDLLEREYRNGDAQEATAAKIDRVFDQLEDQLVEVEAPVEAPTKQADESPEEFRERLESRLDQKKEQVRQTKTEVLDSYHEDVRELTEQFLAAIPDGRASIEAVDAEFQRFRDHRDQLLDETAAHGPAVADTYEQRLETLTASRKAFADAVEQFLEQRDATATAVEDLGTDLGQVDGFDRIVVPFWVVLLERDGEEELVVYPLLNRTQPEQEATQSRPYEAHLQPHTLHDYQQFVDDVREELAGSELLERLRPDEEDPAPRDTDRFAAPSVLRENGAIDDKFVEELQRYEL